MKRNPRKLKWTKAFRKSAGKEMVVDSTLTFAARRNVPVRYNRDLVSTTLKAMQRVSEIRARREHVFYRKRMSGNKERERETNRKLVAENEHLLPRMRGSEKRKLEMQLDGDEDQMEESLLEMASKGKMEKQRAKRRLLVDGQEEDMDVD